MPHSPPLRIAKLQRPLLITLALALGLQGCDEKPVEQPEQWEEWNVLLVTIDSARADHLGCYGREAAKTPHLDQLALEGIRFENAFSTSGSTTVSHAAILTGQNNASHGLRVTSGDLPNHLPAAATCLAELLAERGWRTAAFVSSTDVSSKHGLDRGYQKFAAPSAFKAKASPPNWQDAPRNPTQRRSDDTTDSTLAWLEQHGEAGPWHLWLHYYDLHDVALVPPAAITEQSAVEFDASSDPTDTSLREQLYDIELSYVDTQLGRVLDHLKVIGQFERTVIVVLSDHGQGLADGQERHGWMGEHMLYDWCIQVPLLLKLPEEQGGLVINGNVRTIDVLPTILERLELAPPAAVQGRSLLPMLHGELDEPRISLGDSLNRSDQSAPSSGLPPEQVDDLYLALGKNWKLIYHANSPANSELYDRAKDPQELNNVYGEHPHATERLLRALRDQDIPGLPTEPDPPPTPQEHSGN